MPDVAMWGRALTEMPRIDKEQWDALDLVSRWLIATRSAVIVMTFTSSAFAGVLAYKAGVFDATLFVLVTAGLCLAHATNNLVNDLTDHWKGVDQGNYFRTQYGPQTVEDGFLTVRQLITARSRAMRSSPMRCPRTIESVLLGQVESGANLAHVSIEERFVPLPDVEALPCPPAAPRLADPARVVAVTEVAGWEIAGAGGSEGFFRGGVDEGRQGAPVAGGFEPREERTARGDVE